MEALRRQLNEEGIVCKTDHPLAKHSTFRIGGAAELAVFPSTRQELLRTLELARESGIRPLVIGNGSNIVFPDGILRGVVIFTGGCRTLERDGTVIFADAGVSLASLAGFARDAGLAGAAFAHGIPGTVGGAVFMNAGAYGGSIAGIAESSDWYDLQTGVCGSFTGEEQMFGNRTSIYEKMPQKIILGARFSFAYGDREAITAEMKALMARRQTSQPLEYPSAGSVFKRPVGHFAGKLIEDCGLKGLTVGGASVSRKHAGFIINEGSATAQDVKALVARIQETVLDATGVPLECEIRFL